VHPSHDTASKPTPRRTLKDHGTVLTLFGIAIALVVWGSPEIKAEHRRLARIRAANEFKTEFMDKLAGDPRFAGITVSISTGGDTVIYGQLRSPQEYADLRARASSCRRDVMISLNVRYPHAPHGYTEIFVYSNNESLPPAN
jgi:hypothetical protein